MQISEIEKLIENRTDHHPIDVYIHMLSRGYKLTEIQFISIACRYLNRSPSTRHLVQKWRNDMVFCVSSEELGVCVFYGVKDARGGAMGSIMDICSYPLFFKPEVVSGICEEQCRDLLRDFFEKRRGK